MKVYFISGLGADERAFQALDLEDIEPIHLSWMEPVKNEKMQAYAKRMAARITAPEPIIVGLSFGGMMSIEIAKCIPVKKIILVSSAKGKHELPPYFTICRYLPFHKLLPLQLVSLNTKIMFHILGGRGEEQKQNLIAIIKGTVRGFNKWAIDKIVKWDNRELPAGIFHIHGAKDNLLPHRYVKADHTIVNGGHFMIVNDAKEISALLKKLISH
jgi:esterase/lipase